MSLMSGIKKYKNAIDALAGVQGYCKWYLYLDSIWSRVRYGCVLNHYVVGNFHKRSSAERKKIYTYRDWCKVIATANKPEAIHYMKEKVDFNTFFAEFIGRDWLYSKNMTREEFETFCKKHGGAILKPMSGLEGVGVVFSKLPQDTDGIAKSFEELKSKEMLIEEKIIQHPEMVFGNKSVNTIRVYTAYNPNTKQVTIIKTVVRAGIGDSIVDNSHSGGCAYEIDSELGYIISPYYAANGKSSYIHPKTDICMLGRKIPFWQEVKELCVKGASKLPTCAYIGWDVAITEKGPNFIEGNHLPDLDMIEFVGSYGYKEKIMKGLGLWK